MGFGVWKTGLFSTFRNPLGLGIHLHNPASEVVDGLVILSWPLVWAVLPPGIGNFIIICQVDGVHLILAGGGGRSNHVEFPDRGGVRHS